MTNYFNFYGLPVKFNLNEQELRAKYFAMLKAGHPDFFINDPEKYRESLISSSVNNEAYKCLLNFYSRANHILMLSGLDPDDKLPAHFLMEMMDINEALDELKTEPDTVELRKLENAIGQINQSLENELKELTSIADSVHSFEDMPLKEIKENLLKHKYILRLHETLANIAASK